MATHTRAIRHWKQRFDKDAIFIWRKGLTWEGERVVAGTEIPQSLYDNKIKLRRFWDSGVIELASFVEPDVLTGAVKTEEVKTEEVKTEEVKAEDDSWLEEPEAEETEVEEAEVKTTAKVKTKKKA